MDIRQSQGGESLLQLEIQKVQQSFAMSANDEPEDFEDIQFFHRLPPQLQSFRSAGGNNGDVIRTGAYGSNDGDSGNDSENGCVFPENVLEYGDPQFFPGSCVGYLETILEETDEDECEEESSSGRHWWTPDSDSDTTSVLRQPLPEVQQPPQLPTSFRTTASSHPFELEDLYLLDQLDLAFEETLMKPRRRTGFAFTRDLEFLQSTNAADELEPLTPLSTQRPVSPAVEPDHEDEDPTLRPEDEASEEEGPAEVAEEDFFYSSSASDHSAMSGESSEEEHDGIVLAEFSLANSFSTAMSKANRRSFESPSNKIRSFRSFDSLNSLAASELLFSKADTFPVLNFLGEAVEAADGPQPSSSGSSRSSSNPDDGEKIEVSRKNSGEVSSENLSEDSGISDATGLGSVPVLTDLGTTAQTQLYGVPEPPFALNPLVYSSASEANSMMSSMGSLETPVYMVQAQAEPSAPVASVINAAVIHNNGPALALAPSPAALDNTDACSERGEHDEADLQLVGHDVAEPAIEDPLEDDYVMLMPNNNEVPAHFRVDAPVIDMVSSAAPTQEPCASDLNESESEPIVSNSSAPAFEEEIVSTSRPMSEVDSAPTQTNLRFRDTQADPVNINSNSMSSSSSAVDSYDKLNGRIESLSLQLADMDWGDEDEDDSVSKSVLQKLSTEAHGLPESFNSNLRVRAEAEKNIFPDFVGSRANSGLEDEGPGVEEPLFVHKKAWVCGTIRVEDGEAASVQLQPLAEQHVSRKIQLEKPLAAMETTDSRATPSPLPHKTYGARNEVEVFLVSSRTPSPPVVLPKPDTGSLLRPKTVHFSPVVSEISWRESYADPASEDQCSESSSDNQLDDQEMRRHSDSTEDQPTPELVEKVHVQSQVISEPQLTPMPKKSEKERLRELEPEIEPCPSPSPVLPDLLRQCENASITQSHSQPRERDQRIEEQQHGQVRADPEPEPTTQQQIFPSMFVASGKEAAAAAKAKNGKSAKKGFSIPLPSSNKTKGSNNGPQKVTSAIPPPKPERESVRVQMLEGAESANNGSSAQKSKEKPPKAGFFQRLSKIRLSGSSGSKNKQKVKIYPKEKDPPLEPLKPANKPYTVAAPILKKTNGSTSSPVPPPPQTPPSSDPVQDECSEAFENILEEIAGLNTILQRQSLPSRTTPTPPPIGKRSFAERKNFMTTPEVEAPVQTSDLEQKLSQFKEDASRTRDQISKTQPDLDRMEGVSRQGVAVSPSSNGQARNKVKSGKSGSSPSSASPKAEEGAEKRTEREWYKLLKSAAEKYYHGGSRSTDKQGGKTGIVETDLDTGTSRELLDAELVDLEPEIAIPPPLPHTNAPYANGNAAKARSLSNLTSGLKLSLAPADPALTSDIDGRLDQLLNDVDERAKSLEFLLDQNQKSLSVPPENQLRLENRQLSEHELRIQRSLSKLNVPDWYRKHEHAGRSKSMERPSADRESTLLPATASTTALKLLKRNEYGSSGGLAGGWAGLSAYRTPSLSSLNNARYAGSLNRSNFVRGRPVTMSVSRSSRESLMSPSSTASQSPSAFERSSFTYGMPLSLARPGHFRLSSTSGTSPGSSSPPSTPGPTSAPYVRQPYLGWRSQERINAAGASNSSSATGPPRLSAYRPPAERLAADLQLHRPKPSPNRPTGADRPPLPKPPPRSEKTSLTREMKSEPAAELRTSSPTVHDSIREVTHAINEFVTHGTEAQPPPKPTPRQKHAKTPAMWFESSFVGQKPK